MRQINKKKYKRINLEYIDFREVLDNLGINYSESGKNVSNGWIGTQCCWCGDSSNHLGINIESGSCSCFKCGQSGTIINYLAEELNSFEKAIEVLRDATPRELTGKESTIKERSVNVILPKNAVRKITPYHAGYLHERGFDYKKLTNKYNFHFCGPVGKWKNRIIVPITRRYKLISFTSIDISDDANIRYKHLSAEESIIHVKELIYGIEHTNQSTCCIVEGLFDMFRIGDGAVCGFGTKITSKQKLILSKFSKILIAFDGDEAGREGANKLANELAPLVDVEILDLPEGKDPDKLDKEDIKFIQNKLYGK
jgi:DNA primase